MKLYTLLIFDTSCTLVYNKHNLDDFNFIFRYGIKNNIESFAQKTVRSIINHDHVDNLDNLDNLDNVDNVNNVNNIKRGIYKLPVRIDDHDFVIYGSTVNGFCIMITDDKYPQSTASQLLLELNRELNINTNTNTNNKNTNSRTIDKINIKNIDEMFIRYQDPNEVDKILKLKTSLDETKAILFDSIENLLVRDDELNDLMNRTNILAETSIEFANKTKKLNSCCPIF